MLPLLELVSQRQICQQFFHQSIREFAALNAGGGTYALNCGDPAQSRKPLWGESPPSFPCAFEFVNFGNQAKEVGRDAQRVDIYHTH